MLYIPDMAKTTKVLVTIPDELLMRIDREVASAGRTRSEFLQAAARRQLGWPDASAIDDALARGRAALADLGSFESAEMIRADRDERAERDGRR